MENTSKALLIAAAILIVIILIAFGMRVLNSSKDSVAQAEETGESISDATQKALDKLQASFNKGGGSGALGGTPEEEIPEGGTPEEEIPEGGTPEGGTPEGGIPEGGTPEGGIPEGGTPEPDELEIGKIISTERVLQELNIPIETYTGSYKGDWQVIEEYGDGDKFKIVTTENVTTVTLGGSDIDSAIASYNGAVDTLNAAAIGAIGNISNYETQARSIEVEDLEELSNITDDEKGAGYGKVYKYYYHATKLGICSKYQDNNGNWVDNGGGDKDSFISNDNTKIDFWNRKEKELTHNYYNYTFTDEQKNNYGKIAKPSSSYWLASPCVICNASSALFIVRFVYSGSVIYTNLFGSLGGAYSSSRGVRAVVYI